MVFYIFLRVSVPPWPIYREGLFFTVGHAGDELFLHNQDDESGRDHGEQGSSHDDLPLYLDISAGQHPVYSYQDRVELLFGSYQQRPQVLVPAINKLDYKHGGDRRPCHRKENIPEELHRSCTIDLGCFSYFSGNGHEELPE